MLFYNVVGENLAIGRVNMSKHPVLQEPFDFFVAVGRNVQKDLEKYVKIDDFGLLYDLSDLLDLFLNDKLSFVVNIANLQVDLF